MKSSDVTGILICGAGKMGCDIIAQWLEGGFNVFVFDSDPAMAATARDRVLSNLSWIEQKRKDGERQRVHPDGFAAEAIERLTMLESLDQLGDHTDKIQLVLEVVFEDMAVKQELLVKLSEVMSEDTVFLSNTSSLDVLEMAQPAGLDWRMVGTHFMNPAHIMPGVEVVKTAAVNDDVLEMVVELLSVKLGKTPFVVSNVTGFWVNKMLVPQMLETLRALERGEITVQDGDTGLNVSLGHKQGTFKLWDLIGLDTMLRVALAMYMASEDPRYYPPVTLFAMVGEGNLGQKTGEGFWKWDGMKTTDPVDFSDHTLQLLVDDVFRGDEELEDTAAEES